MSVLTGVREVGREVGLLPLTMAGFAARPVLKRMVHRLNDHTISERMEWQPVDKARIGAAALQKAALVRSEQLGDVGRATVAQAVLDAAEPSVPIEVAAEVRAIANEAGFDLKTII